MTQIQYLLNSNYSCNIDWQVIYITLYFLHIFEQFQRNVMVWSEATNILR